MQDDILEIQLAATPARRAIPADKPLAERVQFAMRYVRANERDLFFMSANPSDDLKFRTALAAVMLAGNDEDRDILNRSLQPLRMLSAMVSGIPVDLSQFTVPDDVLPLMKLWHESEE